MQLHGVTVDDLSSMRIAKPPKARERSRPSSRIPKQAKLGRVVDVHRAGLMAKMKKRIASMVKALAGVRISPYSRRLVPVDKNLELHHKAFLLAGQSRSGGTSGIRPPPPPDTSREPYLERLPTWPDLWICERGQGRQS